jgi:hypothetical protein
MEDTCVQLQHLALNLHLKWILEEEQGGMQENTQLLGIIN